MPVPPPSVWCKSVAGRVVFGDVAEQITKFYSDPANLSIPVLILFSISLNRIRGDSGAETARQLAEWRSTVEKVLAHAK
jgi:hypothetical protein